MSDDVIERRALRILQRADVPLYLFALAAEDIDRIADVARISRDEFGKLIGYQRPEKKQHVNQILDYLDTDGALFPNGLILALPTSVHFASSRGPGASDGLSTAGTLKIPCPASDKEPRPAWIVDGQQRSLALARTRNTRFPVPVAGFVTEDLNMQREQFLRVNTVQPLPTNLVTELLPEVPTPISPRMSARRLPSALVDMLNQDAASPFQGLIRRASTEVDKKAGAVITDNSLVVAIEESLNSPSGVLFPYRNLADGTTDTAGIRHLLLTYWTAVQRVFPEAWGRPSTQSRLMHGIGIRSMGRLMDRIMVSIDLAAPTAVDDVTHELERIAPLCHWTKGTWEDLRVDWNVLQNTPRHISTLSNYLLRAYVQARTSTS
ncbi:DGQHR domain-containing protein DpdB [Kineococcus sp. SYSU DK005]|uniref:DGQHR domain-containing protein DpdB n=1 Tax=Kineococcus sp. SYSU DK005 TaxID=3383126 RepID=UPI003D7F159F